MEAIKDESVRELKVELRAEAGKEAVRKIRNRGSLPGIFYGSRAKALSLSVNPEELVNALNSPKRRNTLIRLVSASADLNGRLVMVKEIQRHPLSRAFLHVDFMEVYSDRPVKASVAVLVKGHAAGIDLGGTLEQHLRFVDIKCPADKIPAAIEIDVTPLGMGQGIHVAALPVGEGIEILEDPQTTVVSVVAPRMVVEEVAAPAEGEEAAAAAEGAEGEAKEGEKGKEGKEGKEAPEAKPKKEEKDKKK